MPVYDYKAYTDKGKKTSGIIDAESVTAATAKLRGQQVYPFFIQEIDAETSTKGFSVDKSFQRFSIYPGIRSSEIAVVTRQLATLLSAGIPLVSSLETLVLHTKSQRFQKVLSKIKGYVEEGKSFAEALSRYPSIFSSMFVNMVQAGESSGTLEIVLERLADIMESRETTKKRIQAALAYPCLMVLVGFFVLVFLLTYIVPGIVSIFTDLNQVLPAPTRALISVSLFFKSFWWATLLVPVIILAGIYGLKKTRKGGLLIDHTLLRIPKIGDLIRKLCVARFTRILGSLLDNGVPMMTALDIAKTTTGNQVIIQMVSQASSLVEQGSELGNALKKHPDFPFLAVQMMKVGEKTGQLEKMLTKTADLYEKEVETTMTALTALIEPLIILGMAVVVGFIVLSICLPIFEMNQLVR